MNQKVAVLTLAGLFIFGTPTRAQSPDLKSAHTPSDSVPFWHHAGDVGGIQIFRGFASEQLGVLPIFAFDTQLTKDRQARTLRVEQEEDIAGRIRIKLTVLPYALSDKLHLLAELRKAGKIDGVDTKTLAEPDLRFVPLRKVSIIDRDEIFEAAEAGVNGLMLDQDSYGNLKNTITLRSKPLDKAQAEIVVNQLKDGKLLLPFVLRFEVPILMKDSQTSLLIEFVKSRLTQLTQDQLNDAPNFEVQATAEAAKGSSTLTAGYTGWLTGYQKFHLADKLRSALRAEIGAASPELLEKAQEWLNKAVDGAFEVKEFDLKADKLLWSSYMIGEEQFKGATLNKILSDITQQIHTVEKKDFTFDQKAKASFPIGEIPVEFESSNNIKWSKFKDHLEKLGWKFETDGTVHLPEKIKFYRFVEGQFESQTKLQIQTYLTKSSGGSVNPPLSTNNLRVAYPSVSFIMEDISGKLLPGGPGDSTRQTLWRLGYNGGLDSDNTAVQVTDEGILYDVEVFGQELVDDRPTGMSQFSQHAKGKLTWDQLKPLVEKPYWFRPQGPSFVGIPKASAQTKHTNATIGSIAESGPVKQVDIKRLDGDFKLSFRTFEVQPEPTLTLRPKD